LNNTLLAHVRLINKGNYLLPRDLDLSCFTVAELGIIAKYGHWLKAVEDGTLAPITAAQRHFVSVCNGSEVPATPFAVAWMKLKDAILVTGGAATSRPFEGLQAVTHNVWTACPECGGRKMIDRTCLACAGTGWLRSSFQPTVAQRSGSRASPARSSRVGGAGTRPSTG
jgi:uncharacterized protein YifE (UPF0438 family)/predicted nucleic acid-binding Zn ribbon protein